jgi:hypothetical protein
MSAASVQDLVTEYLPEALESKDLALTHIKYSFVIGFAVFLILIPFCRSRKSFYDALAARSTIWFARFFIFIEMLLVFCLYYFYFEHGSPLKTNKYLPYGNGDNWLYSYGRPTASLVFIGVGMTGEIHPVIRFMCMIGCIGEVVGAALSAFQVRDYYRQVKYFDAPSNGYTESSLLAYYWRDIISLGVCTTVFMLTALLMVMMGFCEPQLIHPSLVSGKDLDRYAAMKNVREQRKMMEVEGLLGPQKESVLTHLIKTRRAALAAVQDAMHPAERENRNEDGGVKNATSGNDDVEQGDKTNE